MSIFGDIPDIFNTCSLLGGCNKIPQFSLLYFHDPHSLRPYFLQITLTCTDVHSLGGKFLVASLVHCITYISQI